MEQQPLTTVGQNIPALPANAWFLTTKNEKESYALIQVYTSVVGSNRLVGIARCTQVGQTDDDGAHSRLTMLHHTTICIHLKLYSIPRQYCVIPIGSGGENCGKRKKTRYWTIPPTFRRNQMLMHKHAMGIYRAIENLRKNSCHPQKFTSASTTAQRWSRKAQEQKRLWYMIFT